MSGDGRDVDSGAAAAADPERGRMRRIEPFLVALLAGGMAILGGYLASREAFRNERALRDDQRAADTRAAARMLDLELINRMRVTLNAFGFAPPPGDIKRESVRLDWNCVLGQLERGVTGVHRSPTDCDSRPGDRRARAPDRDTLLAPVPWSREDRRLLASRVRGDHWFQISVAVDSWATIADSHASVGRLVRQVAKSPRTAADVVQTVRKLADARVALSPYVVLADG
jgi:hypothetical protein